MELDFCIVVLQTWTLEKAYTSFDGRKSSIIRHYIEGNVKSENIENILTPRNNVFVLLTKPRFLAIISMMESLMRKWICGFLSGIT